MRQASSCVLLISLLLLSRGRRRAAEDGYDLWLRYRPLEQPLARDHYARHARRSSPMRRTPDSAARQSTSCSAGLTACSARQLQLAREPRDGAIVIGTPASSPDHRRLATRRSQHLGREGYLIRSATIDGKRVTVIAANSDVGVLYGAFAFLRLMQTRPAARCISTSSTRRTRRSGCSTIGTISIAPSSAATPAPRCGTGKSCRNGATRDTRTMRGPMPRSGSTARSSTTSTPNAQVLTPLYLQKVAALADTFRPWGIRVFLTARFSAPIEIGGLKTADPLDPQVRAWWRAKADEIYRYVPDFGGFLVKANSEGQPGPQDYGRTHADGANMLADALAPHGGTRDLARVRLLLEARRRPGQAGL